VRRTLHEWEAACLDPGQAAKLLFLLSFYEFERPAQATAIVRAMT
jgi:hypothetical protein